MPSVKHGRRASEPLSTSTEVLEVRKAGAEVEEEEEEAAKKKGKKRLE